MTAVKDISRPTSQHRPSFSSAASYSRSHSHSTSLGTYNPTHRITRRKSSTLNPTAISAALNIAREADDDSGKMPSRRTTASRAVMGSLNSGSYPSPPSSLPHHPSVPNTMQYGRMSTSGGSALVDGPPLSNIADKMNGKSRMRRASEGSTLSKKKSGTGDLKCETCGKGYKHSSCLTKHLWEHTPEWTITSKLLISKHQQVQLLEAASVLVTMNHDADTAKASDSDHSSASPAASGSSGLRDDDISSAETTPPPNGESVYGHRKQYSNASSGYSRSYQSLFSTSEGPATHSRDWSRSSNKTQTAGTSLAESYPDEDHADLAAAVGLLSCSYGTPQSGPVVMTNDIPPVPPLPAKYKGMSGSSFQPRTTMNHIRESSADVEMDEDESSDDNQSQYQNHRFSRAEDDDGIFGKMEE